MGLHQLVGHREARARLARALHTGRLPQVLLFTGRGGVGKQRLALWLAQLVFCEQAESEPCGSCRSCRLVTGLAHPDLHWVVPIARPKAADADKQVAEAGEAIGQVMEERRARSFYSPPDGMAGHGIANVRLLQRQAALTPVESKRKVFIVGDAERLVSQESSPEAANALLKLLEEPPADSIFVLTAVDPRRLLPTMRSRAVLLRLGRLSPAEIAELKQVAASGPAVAANGTQATDETRAAATAFLEGVVAGPGARMERALKQPPYAARGDFTALLDALADTLGEAVRDAVGGSTGHGELPGRLRRHPRPQALLRAIERVAEARTAAAGNVNPQILLATLSEDLAEVL
jgi:DNA polymerase-3 subunit delta'